MRANWSFLFCRAKGIRRQRHHRPNISFFFHRFRWQRRCIRMRHLREDQQSLGWSMSPSLTSREGSPETEAKVNKAWQAERQTRQKKTTLGTHRGSKEERAVPPTAQPIMVPSRGGAAPINNSFVSVTVRASVRAPVRPTMRTISARFHPSTDHFSLISLLTPEKCVVR